MQPHWGEILCTSRSWKGGGRQFSGRCFRTTVVCGFLFGCLLVRVCTRPSRQAAKLWKRMNEDSAFSIVIFWPVRFDSQSRDSFWMSQCLAFFVNELLCWSTWTGLVFKPFALGVTVWVRWVQAQLGHWQHVLLSAQDVASVLAGNAFLLLSPDLPSSQQR